jgi:hypothetical protein
VTSTFDFPHFTQNQTYRKPEAVSLDRPRGDVPEFRYILEREIHWLASSEQPGDAFHRHSMIWMGRLRPPKQDVRVNKDAHLATVAVDAFAADCFV